MLVTTGDFSIESGAASAEQLLDRPDPPTAIFCFNDEMAIGVIDVARKRGVSVPRDLSVVGFDDIRFARHVEPPLTTVATDRTGMARAAVDLVLDDGLRVAGSRRERVKLFPSKLVTRRSCGCV